MFCQCFCPGKRTKYKKDVEIEHGGKIYTFSDIAIETCINSDCKEGYMSSETWAYIQSVVGDDFKDIGIYNLSRKIFAEFRRN